MAENEFEAIIELYKTNDRFPFTNNEFKLEEQGEFKEKWEQDELKVLRAAEHIDEYRLILRADNVEAATEKLDKMLKKIGLKEMAGVVEYDLEEVSMKAA